MSYSGADCESSARRWHSLLTFEKKAKKEAESHIAGSYEESNLRIFKMLRPSIAYRYMMPFQLIFL